MTLRKSGTRPKERWGLLVAATTAALLLIAGLTLAVHDLYFELDGNVTTEGSTTYESGTFDWASFFDANGSKDPTLPDASRPGFTASSFKVDFGTTTNHKGDTVFDTSDSSTFTVGSKDTLDVSEWSCTAANNVTDKGDIMNAYALAYTDPGTGDRILYFGLERNANTGDANVAFWFLQGSATCDTASGTSLWSGNHQDGDLLVVSAFTKGGTVSTIDAYRWDGGADGSLNATPVAHGVDCTDPLTGTGDTTCATSNTGAITTPWLTENKTDGVGHTLQSGEFFEGGLNLTQSGFGDECFNTFVGDTRSSQSLTATLYDYALGTLGECTSALTTTPQPSTSIDLPTTDTTDPSSVTVHDSASLTVTGVSTFSGTLSFHLCGPYDSTDTTSNCSTGGVAAGSQAVTTAGSYDSSDMVLTKAGRYCWRGDFTSNTNGLPDAHDPSNTTSMTECFTVNPVTPSLSTNATNQTLGAAQDFGGTIDDTATLDGTANEPGSGGDGDGSINPTTDGSAALGTIVIKAYGPFASDHTPTSTDCTVSKLVYTSNVSVTGDGDYKASDGDAGAFQPGSPGLYLWVATYGGDSPNTNAAADVGCGSEYEQSFVQQIPTTIQTKQSWYPNDTAIVTSSINGTNLVAGGTVDFLLYDSNSCSGTVLYSERITLTTNNASEQVSTHNYPGGAGTEVPGQATWSAYGLMTGYLDLLDSTLGQFSWKVTYTPAASDTAHTGSSSMCAVGNAELFSITYSNDPGSTPPPAP